MYNYQDIRIIGMVNENVIRALDLKLKANTPIFIGDDNENHMREEHPQDHQLYHTYIPEILAAPDYVSRHPSDGSMQYIKILGGGYVMVAVRPSSRGRLYVKTMFTMSKNKIEYYQHRNAMKYIAA